MRNEERSQIQSVAELLKLRDIQLFTARFERPTKAFGTEDGRVRQENMRNVGYVLGEGEIEGTTHQILQIIVSLGTRAVADTDDEDPSVYVLVEADFLVEYEVTGSPDKDALAAFANYNAVHNVWPFWRHHVFDTVHRARLPHLEVPLFSGTKS